MRLVSFIIFIAVAVTASANGYKPKKQYKNDEYLVLEGTQGYIGDASDYEDGDYVTEGYIQDAQEGEYVPAPPDYRTDTYVEPETYPEFDNQVYEDSYVAPQPESVDEVYERAYAATNGACDTKRNPHSYACTDWNFQGNGVFPLFKMNWKNMQGPWFSVTYVRPGNGPIECRNGVYIEGGENRDCEFSMATNPNRRTQPFGIVNTKSGDLMGVMYIDGKNVSWENWLGNQVWTDPKSFKKLDAYTVQFNMYEGKYSHMFICRDFNRNSNHHLLCKWYMLFPGDQAWREKGFMGFLTQEVWDGFRSQH